MIFNTPIEIQYIHIFLKNTKKTWQFWGDAGLPILSFPMGRNHGYIHFGAVLASGGGAASSGGLAPNCFNSSSVGIASCN